MADPITQVVQSLGLVTAYGYAKSKGYTGTDEEFAEAAAAIGQGAATATAAAEAASEDAETATTAAGTATTAAGNAENSATAALQYMNNAETAATNAGTAQTAAAGSATSAAASAQAAATGEYNAGVAAGASSDYALDSQDHAEDSEAWAVGTENGNPVPETADQYNNNAKYYAEQASTATGTATGAAQAAAASAAQAEAWATGGSGGTASATNNAEYWAGQAAASAEDAETAAVAGTAALANEAPTFDATKAYSAGDYVLYNSVLYRFTADHAAGAWSGTDATAVKIGGEITDIKSAINGITGCSPLNITREKYYLNTSGQTVDLSRFIYDPNFNCHVIPCQEGDTFTINALGGSAPLAWVFAQNDGVILEKTTAADVSDYVTVAPANAAWLIINDKGGRTSYSGKTSTAEFAELRNHDAAQDTNIGANTEDIKRLSINSENHAQAIIDIATPVTTEIATTRTDATFISSQGVVESASASSFYTISANVTAGSKYVVNGYAVRNGYLYIFTDANDNTIYKSTEKGNTDGTDYSEIIATAPDGATKLIVDGNIGGARTPAFIGELTGYDIPDIKTIPTAEVGIIPAPSFPHYPMIDSVTKKIRILYDTVIIDRRTSNKKYYICDETVIDYSSTSSSAIAVYFDVTNSEFITTAYSDTRSAESYLLFMLIRTNVVSANHITVSAAFPVMIDGMLDGVVYSKNQNVRSVNHRGLEQIAPENTLIAFQYSKMAGFDCVETDIRFTQDGVPVLLHDATINRTARNADGTTLTEDVAIADITYDEALTYDFGIWKNARFAGQKIPTFEQFIRACRNLGLHPYIELKVGTEEQVKALNAVVIRNGMQGKVSWISYSIDYLEYIHAVDAKARLGIITSSIVFSEAFTNRILALKGSNEVFVDADNVSAVTSAGIDGLITLGLPLELYTGTIANIVNADPYITGFTLGAFNAGKELIAHYDTVG